MERMPEERRWQAERFCDRMHCHGSRDHHKSESDWPSGDGDTSPGTTSGSMAEFLSTRLAQSTQHTTTCSDQMVFEKEDAEALAAVASAGP